MCQNELNQKIKDLREYKRMKDEIETLIESLQDDIKAEMTAQGTDTLVGTDWKVTWREYTAARIDTTAFRNALPDLAEKFTKVGVYKRFSLN